MPIGDSAHVDTVGPRDTVASFSLAGLRKSRLIPKGTHPLKVVYGLLQVDRERLAIHPTYAQRVVASGFHGRDSDSLGLAHTSSFKDFAR